MRFAEIPLVVLMFVSSLTSVAQREDFIWRFGPTGAGLDFNQCPPTVTSNGPSDGIAFEGTVSIADHSSGAVLFYTNGYIAYNANNVPMVNGDPVSLGNTMAQNVIIPHPGSPGRYYIITPDVQAGLLYNTVYPDAAGINVAEVDMSLAGGLGAVTSKFVSLKAPPNCEMLTAVRNGDGNYWLLGHEYGNNHFFVFGIDVDGISTTPNVYALGPVIVTPQAGVPSGSNWDAIGCMTASPDGTRIAFTTLYNGITALLHFDPSTGTITEPILLDIDGGGYGTSFSPDGTKLYVTRRDSSNYSTFSNGALLQFDTGSDDQGTIQASMNIIHSVATGGFASLKRGPDGKIYVARVGADGSPQGDLYLGVINEPDQSGTSCGYVHNGVYLNGLHGSWGLNSLYETGNACGGAVNASGHNVLPYDVKVQTSADRVVFSWPRELAIEYLFLYSSDGRLVSHRVIPSIDGSATIAIGRLGTGSYVARLVGPGLSIARSFAVVP